MESKLLKNSESSPAICAMSSSCLSCQDICGMSYETVAPIENLFPESPVNGSDRFQMDYINKLPDEILLMVFSELSQKQLRYCSLVCRRWHRMSCDNNLGVWSKANVAMDNGLTLQMLASVIQRGIRTLSLENECYVRDPESLDQIFPLGYTSNLENLDLNKLTISEEGLAVILQCTNRLTKLNLGYCSLNDDCCEAISRNGDLYFLNLQYSSFSTEGLKTILKNCQRLWTLNIGDTELSSETLDTVLPFLRPSLIVLRINGMKGLADRHLFQISKTCPNLVELDIANNYNLTTSSMDTIYGLRYLKYFYYTKKAVKM